MMSHHSLLFAAAKAQLTPRVNEADHSFSSNDILIVITVATGVAAVLVVWAIFFRKKKEEEEYEYPQPANHDNEHSSGEHGERRRRKKKRRRVRDHRPRNPTLQQTGGLPPPRTEDRPPNY